MADPDSVFSSVALLSCSPASPASPGWCPAGLAVTVLLVGLWRWNQPFVNKMLTKTNELRLPSEDPGSFLPCFLPFSGSSELGLVDAVIDGLRQAAR